MEVKQTLKVSADCFFDTLAASVSYDISRATGITVRPEQIHSGYRYTKKMKNKVKQEGDVQVTIDKYEYPVCYQATFQSAQGINLITYEIEDHKDGSITVLYGESFEGSSAAKTLNYKLVSIFFQHGGKKRMTRTLKAMEEFILNGDKRTQ